MIVVGTQFPDFLVVTSDGYLDILEIKEPGTQLLREDTSRHNFYWAPEIAKAISQVENYIDHVTKHSDAIRRSRVTTTTLIFGLLSHAASSLPGRQASLPGSQNGLTIFGF